MEKDNELLNIIECYSNFYKNSEEYTIGKKILYYKNNIKKGRILFLIKKILKKIFLNNKKEKNETIVEFPEGIKVNTGNSKKIAIYTCITGKYDKVEEPVIIEENCDYYLFTNNEELKSDVWKIVKIPENILKLEDNILINRYIKMHPFELFKEYEYSIYIDGNIKIMRPLSNMIECINESTGLAIHRHITNKDIYDEIKNCISYKKGNTKSLKKTYKKLKKEKYPNDSGVFQCNVLVSEIINNQVQKIFSNWWEMFCNPESCKRDQIYLPYVLWKMKIDKDDIGNLGNDITQNTAFIVMKHIS